MQRPKPHMTDRGPINGIEVDLRSVGEWRPVATQVRTAILEHRIMGTAGVEDLFPDLPRELLSLQPSQDDVEALGTVAEEAARAGRLIDFGDWTQEVMVHGGNRGGPLYTKGLIGNPFREPWLFMHTWEGATAVYLVNLLERDKPAGGECEIVELNPARLEGFNALMMGDRVFLEPRPDEPQKYHAHAIPSIWRYLPGVEAMNGGKSPESAAAGNVLDPLMTALLILSTKGIARSTVTTSEKLAKARAKARKPPIPPYDVVDSRPYVTAIMARKARGRTEAKGGHHASPVPHFRMGHVRTLESGVQTFVRDALVNMTEDAKRAWMTGRSHYVVKP